MLFSLMLSEVPLSEDPVHRPEITTIPDLLLALDQVLISAPSWSDPDTGNILAAPINTILNWPMATKAGFAAFLNADINEHLQRILTHWAHFLSTPESCVSLTPDCWFSPAARSMPGMRNFQDTYICDPAAPHMGFRSWDDFFTRRLRPGTRPLPFPLSATNSPEAADVIVNACESIPFALQRSVALHDRFWLKKQPYSLAHMFDDESLARQFEGGTVYQAFLSPDSYHRWHAPVSGRVVKKKVVKGLYFSEPLCCGFWPDDDDDDNDDGDVGKTPSGIGNADPAACNNSQGYLTSIAPRGILVIGSTAPSIGLVAMVLVGMGEVSSIDITVSDEEVQRGDEMGMFHYGGSTWCLVLQKGVNVEFEAEKDISRMRGAETGMMMMMDEDMPIESRKVNSFLGKVKKFVRR